MRPGLCIGLILQLILAVSCNQRAAGSRLEEDSIAVPADQWQGDSTTFQFDENDNVIVPIEPGDGQIVGPKTGHLNDLPSQRKDPEEPRELSGGEENFNWFENEGPRACGEDTADDTVGCRDHRGPMDTRGWPNPVAEGIGRGLEAAAREVAAAFSRWTRNSDRERKRREREEAERQLRNNIAFIKAIVAQARESEARRKYYDLKAEADRAEADVRERREEFEVVRDATDGLLRSAENRRAQYESRLAITAKEHNRHVRSLLDSTPVTLPRVPDSRRRPFVTPGDSEEGQKLSRLQSYRDYVSGQVTGDAGRKLIEIADAGIEVADEEFGAGRPETGDVAAEIAFAALDFALSIAPGVSWGRDIYEAITGADLLTGAELDDLTRGLAVVGAMTVGIGGKGRLVQKGLDAVEKIGKKLGMEAFETFPTKLSYVFNKLNAKFDKHKAIFGITDGFNHASGANFINAIEQHVADPRTQKVIGRYRGSNPAVHYFNGATRINVISHSDGTFWSVWKLDDLQIDDLINNGHVW